MACKTIFSRFYGLTPRQIAATVRDALEQYELVA